MSARYELIGLTASPYSMKVRALMRYRRIPFDWIVEMPQFSGRPVAVAPVLLPILRHPMGRDMTDSTAIAHMLEREIVNDRRVMPEGARAFLCHLIEDLADEWLTKAMFWYRWRDEASADFATGWIVAELRAGGARVDPATLGPVIHTRQRGRMEMIGAVPANAPVIEAGFRDVLAALAPICAGRGYLFGTRPSLADFALFGQLSQLGTDPAPAAILRDEAPEVLHWLRRIDDASGVEGAWGSGAEGLEPLLTIAGRDYLPFLAANEAALAAGRDMVEVELGSGPFRNRAYRWQAKCLARLKALHAEAELDTATRALLDRTGCTAILAA